MPRTLLTGRRARATLTACRTGRWDAITDLVRAARVSLPRLAAAFRRATTSSLQFSRRSNHKRQQLQAGYSTLWDSPPLFLAIGAFRLPARHLSASGSIKTFSAADFVCNSEFLLLYSARDAARPSG